jgi:hypothetical protein
MVDYAHKYLKYKTKYENALTQLQSGNSINNGSLMLPSTNQDQLQGLEPIAVGGGGLSCDDKIKLLISILQNNGTISCESQKMLEKMNLCSCSANVSAAKVKIQKHCPTDTDATAEMRRKLCNIAKAIKKQQEDRKAKCDKMQADFDQERKTEQEQMYQRDRERKRQLCLCKQAIMKQEPVQKPACPSKQMA